MGFLSHVTQMMRYVCRQLPSNQCSTIWKYRFCSVESVVEYTKKRTGWKISCLLHAAAGFILGKTPPTLLGYKDRCLQSCSRGGRRRLQELHLCCPVTWVVRCRNQSTHWRNLANNIGRTLTGAGVGGGVGNRPCVLGTQIFLLSLLYDGT